MHIKRWLLVAVLIGVLHTFAHAQKYSNVDRIIVIMMENWSFDSLFGNFDNVEGISRASTQSTLQVDKNDVAYDTLPQVQPEVPKNLPNKPFDLSPYINMSAKTLDLTHAFYTEQFQINDGKMNKFAAYSSAQGLAMSYYDMKNSYLGQLARNYTIFDNWYHAFFGGSWANHQWLITSLPCPFPNAPPEIVNVLDDKGVPLSMPAERIVTPDGYAVNTVYSSNPPFDTAKFNASRALPLQNQTTIGDLLTEAKVTWKWYSGGWTDAMNGKPDPSFQYHHQPFNYYANYAPGKPGRDNLQDENDMLNDLAQGTLPQVTFYKPIGKENMHPGYSLVGDESEKKLITVMNAIRSSKYWNNCLVFITFDEHGGRWDHVAPPKVDRWGPGIRIPTIAISPLVKKGYIEKTQYDTTAIMKMIQDKYKLRNIGTRDQVQKSFDNIFENNMNSSRGWMIAGIVIACLATAVLIIGILFFIVNVVWKRKPPVVNEDTATTRYYRVW